MNVWVPLLFCTVTGSGRIWPRNALIDWPDGDTLRRPPAPTETEAVLVPLASVTVTVAGRKFWNNVASRDCTSLVTAVCSRTLPSWPAIKAAHHVKPVGI